MLETKQFGESKSFIPLVNESSKTIYQNLCNIKCVKPIAEIKWEKFFNLNINFRWSNIWKNGGCKLLDFEDRDIWFKLKHRILPTKDKLLKMKITTDNICPLCSNETETIEHLFIYCQKHLTAWIFVENLLRKIMENRLFFLNDINKILGKDLNEFALCIVGKLHRVIWSIRCDILNNSHISHCPNILNKYISALKGFIILEQKRLTAHEFMTTYAKKQILFKMINDKIIFSF